MKGEKMTKTERNTLQNIMFMQNIPEGEEVREKRLRSKETMSLFFIPPVFRQTVLHVHINSAASLVLVSIFFPYECKVSMEGMVAAMFATVCASFPFTDNVVPKAKAQFSNFCKLN